VDFKYPPRRLKFSLKLTDIVMKGRTVSKSSYVLRALSILGPEEILKLSEVMHHKENSLKKAAGEDLVVWDESSPASSSKKSKQAKILPFPKDLLKELAPEVGPTEVSERDQSSSETIDVTELVLKQREINRNLDENSHKLDAVKGYKTATEAYLVKSGSIEGVKEHRFANTCGVLVDKKIA
jgi:hypothetical protein